MHHRYSWQKQPSKEFTDIYYPNSLSSYKYSDVRTPYGTELLKVSEREQSILSNLCSTPVTLVTSPFIPPPVNVIIDTDLGTDFDDALALLQGLHTPGLNILGITTNYAVSTIRAAMVSRITAHYPEIPVIAGSSRPIGASKSIFVTGFEGRPFLSEEERLQNWIPRMNGILQLNAVGFLINAINSNPNKISILSIGIPTNLGLALLTDPSIASKINEVVIMACGSTITQRNNHNGNCSNYGFPPGDYKEWLLSGHPIHMYPNHNINSDVKATKMLFGTHGLRIKIIPHDITSKFWFEGKGIDFLRKKARDEPESTAGVVGQLMNVWFYYRNGQNGQCPHDPLTLYETRFTGEESALRYARGWLVVHEWAAFSTFVPNEDGDHYLAVEIVDGKGFMDSLEKAVMEEE